MNKTYEKYIKPNVLYWVEILATVNTTLKNRLETSQNKALRIVTGEVKTKLTVAL